VRLLLKILTTALADQQLLPARTAAEFAAQLRAEPMTEGEGPLCNHDSTERP
jgi:hypothetical protein